MLAWLMSRNLAVHSTITLLDVLLEPLHHLVPSPSMSVTAMLSIGQWYLRNMHMVSFSPRASMHHWRQEWQRCKSTLVCQPEDLDSFSTPFNYWVRFRGKDLDILGLNGHLKKKFLYAKKLCLTDQIEGGFHFGSHFSLDILCIFLSHQWFEAVSDIILMRMWYTLWVCTSEYFIIVLFFLTESNFVGEKNKQAKNWMYEDVSLCTHLNFRTTYISKISVKICLFISYSFVLCTLWIPQ